MLNKKFIIEHMVEVRSFGNGTLETIYGSRRDSLQDLVKVLCNITGTNYDNLESLAERFKREEDGVQRGVWYDWAFFRFKAFKKGSMHLEFTDKNAWYMLNQAYGKLKGFTLSEKYQ